MIFRDEISGDKRDLLTDELIKKDLTAFVKSRMSASFIYLIPTVLIGWLIIAQLFSGHSEGIIVAIIFLPSWITFAVNVVVYFCKALPYIKALAGPRVLAVDKLVGFAEEGGYFEGLKRWEPGYFFFDLHFASYGRHTIPTSLMTRHTMLYNTSVAFDSSQCGDEFFVVLTKPDSGKVLLTYSTKAFRR